MKKQISTQGNTTIIVLAAITAFALLGLFSFMAINANKALARDAQRISDMNVIRAALSLYSQKNNGYPVSPSPLPLGIGENKVLCSPSRDHISAGGSPRDGIFKDNAPCNAEQVFLQSIPQNPRPASNEYIYSSTPDGTDYNILFILETNYGALEHGAHCAKSAGITKC